MKLKSADLGEWSAVDGAFGARIMIPATEIRVIRSRLMSLLEMPTMMAVWLKCSEI